jgi:hypothetical protein
MKTSTTKIKNNKNKIGKFRPAVVIKFDSTFVLPLFINKK